MPAKAGFQTWPRVLWPWIPGNDSVYSAGEARLRQATHAEPMDGEQATRFTLAMILAAHRPRHRRDIGDIEVVAAEGEAGRRLDGKADDAIDHARGIETHEAPRVDFDAPDIALFVDRSVVRKAAKLVEARERAARAHFARRDVVVIGVDRSSTGIREIQGSPVGAPARSVRADDPVVGLVRRQVGSD